VNHTREGGRAHHFGGGGSSRRLAANEITSDHTGGEQQSDEGDRPRAWKKKVVDQRTKTRATVHRRRSFKKKKRDSIRGENAVGKKKKGPNEKTEENPNCDANANAEQRQIRRLTATKKKKTYQGLTKRPTPTRRNDPTVPTEQKPELLGWSPSRQKPRKKLPSRDEI